MFCLLKDAIVLPYSSMRADCQLRVQEESRVCPV